MSADSCLHITKYNVKITLINDMLGTTPKVKEIFAGYLADQALKELEKNRKKGLPLASGEANTEESAIATVEEEQGTVPDLEDRGWTGFHEDDKGIFVYDYFVKGFLCEAARTLKELNNVKQLQDKFKRYVFVFPRRIRLPEIGGCKERPIRAQTPQGPRVALIRSDFIREGTEIEFQIRVLKGGQISDSILEAVLSYGELVGLGQWRSGGWGRFTFVTSRLDG
jgi:hypothetical protein